MKKQTLKAIYEMLKKQKEIEHRNDYIVPEYTDLLHQTINKLLKESLEEWQIDYLMGGIYENNLDFEEVYEQIGKTWEER